MTTIEQIANQESEYGFPQFTPRAARSLVRRRPEPIRDATGDPSLRFGMN
ncbi:MAG TPA: hypothetical protein VMU84_01630 [Thermoanaerobaculia bacterium]|nr:hypothetical protein [Thermoanaerobaculia bacterium]